MNHSRTIISICVVTLLVLATLGISYAHFTDNLSGLEGYASTIKSNDGKLEIAYSGGNNIEISNINPGNDEVYAKSFSIRGTNTNANNLTYKLRLVIDENSYNNNSISYILTGYNPIGNGVSIESASGYILNGINTIDLGNGYFSYADAVVHTYNLKFYYFNSQNEGNSVKLRAHLEIVEDK